MTSQLDHSHYVFAEHFSTINIDMLCPFGQSKYFGVSTEEFLDPSLVPDILPHVPVTPPSKCLETLLMDKEDGVFEGCELRGDDEDEEVPLTFQEALIAESSADAPSQSSSQLLPQDLSAPPLPHGPGIRPDDYVRLYNDRWVHKQTVCRLVINLNKDFISKSLNHLECVREGFTKVNKWINMSAGRITDRNLFLVGDIFITILRTGQTLSIGVLHLTSASLNGVSRASVSITLMKALRTTAKITGQLLSVIANQPTADSPPIFLWDGGYVTSHSVIQGSSQSTEWVIVVTVLGSLVEPIYPAPMFIQLCNNVNTDTFSQVHGGQSTWEISWDVLQGACDLLWAKAVDIQVPLRSIATVTPSLETNFPYQCSDGKHVFHCLFSAVVLLEACNLLAASDGDRVSICSLCDLRVRNMCNHMGEHILHALSNTPEEVVLKEHQENVTRYRVLQSAL
jgi:hypothetical protein